MPKMPNVQVKQLPVPCLYLGEGPHWQEDIQALLFVDVFEKTMYRYYVNTDRIQTLHIDDGGRTKTLTIAVPVEGLNDWYVVSLGNTICGVKWKVSDPDRSSTTPRIFQVTQDSHFNDGKCDPRGRLWAGTMGPQDEAGEMTKTEAGSLFRVDPDLTLTKCVDKVSVSNGLTWSLDKTRFYYIDSDAFSVDVFHYDDTTGAIKNRSVLLDYKKSNLGEDIPDGMTIDVDGNLWVANFKGNKVICVHPETGQILRQVDLPSKNVTSVCWGGEDYATLFVTSGKMRLSAQEVNAMPAAGATFAVTGLGTKGMPPYSFRPDLDLFKRKMGI